LFIQGVNSSGTHLLDCVFKDNKGTVETYEWLFKDLEMFADGGAISVKDFAAVRIEGGKIEGNSTTGDGGGVYATSFAMVKTDGTTFVTNTSGLGGGLHATFGSLVRVASCTFSGNTATRVSGEENPVGGSGAGISTRAARILIEDTSFTGNVAEYAGGAIVSFCSRDMRKNPGASWVELEGLLHNITEIRRCTFTGNRSTTYGGGAIALLRTSPRRSDEGSYFGFIDLIKPNAKRKVHHWTMTDCTLDGNVCSSNAADPHGSGVPVVDGVYAKDTNDVFYDDALFRQLLAGAFRASGLLTGSGLTGGDIVAKYAPAYNWAIPDLLTDTFLRNRIIGTVAGHARLVVGNPKVPLIPLNPPKFVHDIGMGSVVEPLVVLNP